MMTTDETPVAATETKKRRTANTPAADLNLKDLSLSVSAKWALTPAITLMWTTPAAFGNTANLFDTSLGERITTGGGRASVTNDLKSLDTKINQHTGYLKDYLKEKYGKDNFISYFPQFGISMRGKSYSYPPDRNKRSAALKLTLAAITANALQDRTYGLAFWQDIQTKYEAALALSVNTDSSVAGLVSAKNEHRKQIQKTLNALIHILKGNYPDTYAGVLREWGFQKEKY